MSVLTVLAVVGVVVLVVGGQLVGGPIRAKRLIVLPAVLTLIGALDLGKDTVDVTGTDALLIAIGAVLAAAIGLAQGRATTLEERDGGLWGRLPPGGLWFWALLLLSRGVLIGVAHATGARVAAGTQSELLILGVSRLGQAASVAARAWAAGIPLAAERDGSRPLGGLFPPASPPGAVRPAPARRRRRARRR